MKKLLYKITLLPALCLLLGLGACSEDKPGMDLDGETFINALSLDGYDAEIDNVAKTVTVGVPFGFDASKMKLTKLELQPGATADISVGQEINCTVPHYIRVTNGDVFTDYMMTIAHDNAYFESFTIDSKYQGSIDNEARTILVFVPLEADLTSMLVTFTTNSGTSVSPQSGSTVDFTNPVQFVATNRTASITYTVTVVRDDMSQEPKAFIGNTAAIEDLGAEAAAAAQWMLSNVPNSVYVSIQLVLDGSVKLSEFKMIWCHLDFTDWPGYMWDTRDLFNDYYIKGGNILASRDGARYINDVWRIALDQQCPNNMFGGDSTETLAADQGFCISGNESHPLFKDLTLTGSNVNLLGAGCTTTARTLQWDVNADPYNGMAGWEERTGAKALAYANDGNTAIVTIAEFAPREVLKGFMSGCVVTVGAPSYEWNNTGAPNSCEANLHQFTKNLINYLCK